jgi:hypothetical protein
MAVVRRFALGLVRADKAKGSVKNKKKISQLEYGCADLHPSAQVIVNLNTVQWVLIEMWSA